MIVNHYPPKKVANPHIGNVMSLPPKKPTMVLGTPPAQPMSGSFSVEDIKAATKMGIDVTVYRARDAIVKRNYANCPFMVGEIVKPRTKEDYENYGECRIVGIAKTYADYNEKDWGDNHVPRIILFESENPKEEHKNKHFVGTINFFEKAGANAC